MKFVCLVLVLAVQWASASIPCNPAAAFHGSECNCPSQAPPQFKSFVIALPYPTLRRQFMDVEVQQAKEQNEPKKWETFDYRMRMPTTSDFAFRVAPAQPQMQNLEAHISHLDLSQSPCKCGGANCNCGAAPAPVLTTPRQTFAPMDFYPSGGQPSRLRFRRSADSEELNAEELRFLKDSTPVKSKSSSKKNKSSSFKAPLSEELHGDSYVLERQH